MNKPNGSTPPSAAPYQLLPPLSAEEFAALRADIKDHGVLVAVEYDEDGAILDGHHRIQICNELGIKVWPRVVRTGMSEADKLLHVRNLNLARGHLSRDQRRELIEQQLRETPKSSDRKLRTDWASVT